MLRATGPLPLCGCGVIHKGLKKTSLEQTDMGQIWFSSLGVEGLGKETGVMQIKSRGWSPSPTPTILGALTRLGIPRVEPICKLVLFLPSRNPLSFIRGLSAQGMKTLFATVFYRCGKG